MSLWLVRAGRDGEQQEAALQYGLATIGWNELPDLSSVASKEELRNLYEEKYPDQSRRTVADAVGQIWRFAGRIQVDDLIALPLKPQSAVAFGRVLEPYQYRDDLSSNVRHVRRVEWLRTDLPRTSLEQDLLFSLGAQGTVRQIQRNNAEKRVRALLAGTSIEHSEEVEEPDETEAEPDIEQIARDQILDHLNRRFKGHDLARLVGAVLQAQGYTTEVSKPGPDGGVDIVAGTGSMGFGSPRLCVQVKSSQTPADVTVLRSLYGSMDAFGADQGVLVCWGGFNRAVLEDARRSFFRVRLWDSGDLLENILKNYERLPETLQTELPLKRIWGLVLEA